MTYTLRTDTKGLMVYKQYGKYFLSRAEVTGLKYATYYLIPSFHALNKFSHAVVQLINM